MCIISRAHHIEPNAPEWKSNPKCLDLLLIPKVYLRTIYLPKTNFFFAEIIIDKVKSKLK